MAQRIMFSNDNVSHTQIQKETAVASYNYNYSDNQFLYFSYLHHDDDDKDNDDTQTAYKRALKEISKLPPPLGLKFTLAPEMLQPTKEKGDDVKKLAAKKVEKLKAVQFPMDMLRIGYFKVEAKYPSELIAKCYYARQKLAWEILCDGLKYKIEIPCQNISAIRAVIEENSPGILEIELDKVPSFFREIEPKPGKHTMWTISHDFTDGKASEYRRHYLQFPPGVLDQNYMKLLQSDNRLLELSQRSFPSSHSVYFNSHLDEGTTQFYIGHDLHAIVYPYSLSL